MKKFLLVPIAFLLFGTSTALADIIPEGQKAVPACSIFANLSNFPKIKLVAQEKDMQGKSVYVYEVKTGDCVAVKGYKLNPVKVYAVSSNTTISANYDPSKDYYAFPTNVDLMTHAVYYPDQDPTTYVHASYTILGVDNSNKKLIVGMSEKITNMLTAGYKVVPVAGLNDQIYVIIDNIPLNPPFSDVTNVSPNFNAIAYLKGQGIVSGYPDGTFKPDNKINRAEFTKIVVGAMNDKAKVDSCINDNFKAQNGVVFSDVKPAVGNEPPTWYLDYVCYAKVKGIVKGYDDGTFKPEQNINFVEAAKIVVLALNVSSHNETTPWYKNYVLALETVFAIPTTIKTFNQQLTRGEMAEIVYRVIAHITSKASTNYSSLK